MKIWGNECIDPCILDLSTRWRWVVNFTLWPLYPQERAPSIHWMGGWVGPKTGLDEMDSRKFLPPSNALNSDTSAIQHTANHYKNHAISHIGLTFTMLPWKWKWLLPGRPLLVTEYWRKIESAWPVKLILTKLTFHVWDPSGHTVTFL
jgi:hypothetical protein